MLLFLLFQHSRCFVRKKYCYHVAPLNSADFSGLLYWALKISDNYEVWLLLTLITLLMLLPVMPGDIMSSCLSKSTRFLLSIVPLAKFRQHACHCICLPLSFTFINLIFIVFVFFFYSHLSTWLSMYLSCSFIPICQHDCHCICLVLCLGWGWMRPVTSRALFCPLGLRLEPPLKPIVAPRLNSPATHSMASSHVW